MEGMGQLGLGFPCATGAQRLEAYLIDNGLSWVVRLAALLRDLDYSAFVRVYKPTGRRALHPRTMLGLVVYGILNRQ
jgi:hypothetical protein